MAKFNSSAVGGDIRGKIGSSVFSRNKGGAYVRTKVTPVNPRTAKQQQVRQNFGQNSKAWSGTLTDAQRAAWNAFAASNPVRDVFGNSIILTGLATFNRMNQVLLQTGAAVILDPPTDYSVPTQPVPNELIAVGDSTSLNMEVPAGPVVAGSAYYVYATPNLAPGKNPNQNLYRYIGTYARTVSTAASINLTADYIAVFGDNTIGKKVFVDAGQVNTATGAVLTGTKLEATVTN